MSGIAFRTLVRRSEVSPLKSFESVNECFKFFETNNQVSTQQLYNAFKYLSSDMSSRKETLKDERFSSLLNQLEGRVGTLNSSYLGNFATRLHVLSRANLYSRDEQNSFDYEKAKKLLEKIATTVVDKGGHIKEIVKVSYAAANMGVENHPIYDFEKQQLTLNIDLATPECINYALQTAYKRSSKDSVYLALLCEKLSELTDRFTASDVTLTLKSLNKIGLMKGFLLRRLHTLLMDNLEQFTETNLAQSAYRLASMKFFTTNNFRAVYKHLKDKVNSLPVHSRVELVATSYLSEVPTDDPDAHSLLDSLKDQENFDQLVLMEYVYGLVYYKRYGDELQKAVDNLLKRNPFMLRKPSVMAKEVLDSIPLESKVKVEVGSRWKENFDHFEKLEKERLESQSIFQESKRMLESLGNFKFLEKVGPYVVAFVDEERKVCIDLEHGQQASNLALKLRNLNALGYKAGVVKYWEWRRLKTETAQSEYVSNLLQSLLNYGLRSELQYAFRLYDKDSDGKLSLATLKTLLKSIGIYLTKGELEFLEYEESMRGGFTLEDLYSLGESFYNNKVIKEKVMESLKEHFGNSGRIDKYELKELLIKLGKQLRVSEYEIEMFFKFYLNDEVSRDLTYEKLIDE